MLYPIQILHYNVAFTFKWYGNSWKKNVLSPKGLNWVQHLVSRIGLLSLQWMHPKKMLFSKQNITCEVAYICLVSNWLRLNNDSAGSHIKVIPWFCTAHLLQLQGQQTWKVTKFTKLDCSVFFFSFQIWYLRIWIQWNPINTTTFGPWNLVVLTGWSY